MLKPRTPDWLSYPLVPQAGRFRYSIVLLSTGLAVLLWAIFGQQLAASPFLLFTAAVALSAFWGGLGPALATIVGSTVASAIIYYVPSVPFEARDSHGTQVVAHFLMFLLVSALIAALQLARRQAERALALQALHDHLTGLPNRRLFTDRLQQLLEAARRSSRPFALVLLDLDGFKAINDSYGHPQGDVVLIEMARRLRSLARASDTTARVGGDEFALLLPDTAGTRAGDMVKELDEVLRRPIVLGRGQLIVSASMGLAVYPGDGETEESLAERADAAMYRSKRGAGPRSGAPSSVAYSGVLAAD